MSFKLIEIQKPSPPGVLVIKARSRGSLTILLISLPIGIFAFLVLKDFSPSYTEPVKPFFIFNDAIIRGHINLYSIQHEIRQFFNFKDVLSISRFKFLE